MARCPATRTKPRPNNHATLNLWRRILEEEDACSANVILATREAARITAGLPPADPEPGAYRPMGTLFVGEEDLVRRWDRRVYNNNWKKAKW